MSKAAPSPQPPPAPRYRWRVEYDPDATFEECNGESRPLTEEEYAENYYMDKDRDTRIPYAEYLRYYGNPDRHVYLQVILQARCPCCGSWETKGSLCGIDFMDDSPEAGCADYQTTEIETLPGYLKEVAKELLEEAQHE